MQQHRADLGLTQREVAEQIDISPWTYRYWEQGVHEPTIHHWPAIIRFLGRDPSAAPKTLGDHVRAWRRAEGLPRSRLASVLEIDEGTLWLLETNAYSGVDSRVREVMEVLRDRFRLPS